ncbi:MAG: hypothetical protein A4S09_04140 [Proteobacteria bacterium SG_bin7]|nr:MAG: hypothetical protein A4S09_04140 [Proteobacteria bacterium SG_bin7]
MKFLLLIFVFPLFGFAQDQKSECPVTKDELKELQKISNCARAASFRECGVKSGSGVDGNTLGGTQGRYLGVYSAVETSDQIRSEPTKKKNEVSLIEWVWNFAFADMDHNAYFTDEVNRLAGQTEEVLNSRINDTRVSLTRLEQTAYHMRVEAVEGRREAVMREFIEKKSGKQGEGALKYILEKIDMVPRIDVSEREALWLEASDRADAYFGESAKDFRQSLKAPSYHLSKPDVANDLTFLKEQGGNLNATAKQEVFEVVQTHEALKRNLPILEREQKINSAFLPKNSGRLTIANDSQTVRAWLENVVSNYQDPRAPSNGFQKVYDVVGDESRVKIQERSQRAIEAGRKAAEAEARLAMTEAELDQARRVAANGAKKFGLRTVGYAMLGPVGAALAVKDNVAMAAEILSGNLSCHSYIGDRAGYTPYKKEVNGESCTVAPDIKYSGYNDFLNRDYEMQEYALIRNSDLCKITQEMVKKYKPTDWLLTCTSEGFEARNEAMKVKSVVRLDTKTGLPKTVVLEGDESYIENGRTSFLMEKGEVDSICVRKSPRLGGLVKYAENKFQGNLFCHPAYNNEVRYEGSMASESLFAKENRSEGDDEKTMKKIGDQGIQFFQVHSFAFNEMSQCCSKASTTYSGPRCDQYMKKGMKAQLRSASSPTGSKKTK